MFPKKDYYQASAFSCLKCHYHELIKEGKQIIASWDQKSSIPPRLVEIQHQLAKLKKEITAYKHDAELKFCTKHPSIFEFIPLGI